MESLQENKIRARQQRIFSLFLEGNSQTEIAKIEGINRKTVGRDLKELQTIVEKQTIDIDKIYLDAYENIKTSLAKVQERAENSKRDADSARLWKVVQSYDRLLTELFHNQQSNISDNELENTKKQALAVVDFLYYKLGVEGITEFQEYFHQRKTMENW